MLCANESIDLQAMSYLISKGADVNHHGDVPSVSKLALNVNKL